MTIAVAGAGAFGTALAIEMARCNPQVILLVRDEASADAIRSKGESPRLPGAKLPDNVEVTAAPAALSAAAIVLLAIPAQKLRDYLLENSAHMAGKSLVACCKGIDLKTLAGPSNAIAQAVPSVIAAVLTGPSFAADIARGLPTALTLACEDDHAGRALQQALSTDNLRVYRTTDVIGAELGGALKNVVAIACGAVMGAGLGESARAALMTRGYAEMARLGSKLGAQPQTLAGLSGFGDLALTCTSTLSRNYRHGFSIGRGEKIDQTMTVEGVATAKAVEQLAAKLDLDMPISRTVSHLCAGDLTVPRALEALYARPLKEE